MGGGGTSGTANGARSSAMPMQQLPAWASRAQAMADTQRQALATGGPQAAETKASALGMRGGDNLALQQMLARARMQQPQQPQQQLPGMPAGMLAQLFGRF